MINPEIIVEAVGDRRADAELCLREQLLHGLRQHMGGRVPDDAAAVLGIGRDRLDLGVGFRGPGQILQRTIHTHDDDGVLALAGQAGLPHRGPRRRPGRHPDWGHKGRRVGRSHRQFSNSETGGLRTHAIGPHQPLPSPMGAMRTQADCARNVFRYARGETPVRRRNCSRKFAGEPNPTSRPIHSTESADRSRSCWA
ncbi:Uncharacterised protein [Mycobacteroides abscessus subsp. abscessus]|nr:Uncharacterised protein [Mycobacteroides abscessus subsp. abscessus]